jgi:hypothetical protein
MLHLVPLAGAGRKVADMDRHVELVSDALQLMLGFELAHHSLGLVVEGGDDLVGVFFRAPPISSRSKVMFGCDASISAG